MYRNVASQKLTVYAYDSTTNAPKTGDAANITAYVSKDDASLTVLADTSAAEVSATNGKGYYTFDLAQGETDAEKLLFTAKSSTANVVVIAKPEVEYTGVRATNTSGAELATAKQISGPYAATYHVAPAGSNANAGSADAPWLTIKYACDNAAANSLILVGPGVYDETTNVCAPANTPVHIKFIGCPIVKTSIADSSASGSGPVLAVRTDKSVWWEGPVIVQFNGSAGQTIYIIGTGGAGATYRGPAANGYARFTNIYCFNGDTDFLAWVPSNADTNLIVEGCIGYVKWDGAIMTMKDGTATFKDTYIRSIGGSVGQGGPPSVAHVFVISNSAGSGTAYVYMENTHAEAIQPEIDTDSNNDAVGLSTSGTPKIVLVAKGGSFHGRNNGGADQDVSIGTNTTAFFSGVDFNFANSGVAGSLTILPTMQPGSYSDNTITAASLASSAITAAKIATDAITAAKIAANAITSAELADGAITAAKFAAAAITSTVAPNLDVAISTVNNKLGTPAGASVSADIAAVAVSAGAAPTAAAIRAEIDSNSTVFARLIRFAKSKVGGG